MLSRAPAILRQAVPGLRAFATSQSALAGVVSNTKEFTEEFVKVAPPNFSPPAFPSEFLKKKGESAEPASGVPEKVTLNFYMPHDTHMKSEEVSS